MTAAGYDEAVENGIPFSAEPDILAQESADPVALTEAEAITRRRAHAAGSRPRFASGHDNAVAGSYFERRRRTWKVSANLSAKSSSTSNSLQNYRLTNRKLSSRCFRRCRIRREH